MGSTLREKVRSAASKSQEVELAIGVAASRMISPDRGRNQEILTCIVDL
jgi:hypothetical protein